MRSVDLSALDDGGRIALAREFVTNFSASLPKELYAGSFTLKSKLPFKATSLREVLFHRATELGSVAVELFESNRLVPAFVVTRAIVETVAALYWLHEKVSQFLDSKDIEAFGQFLTRALVGSKDGTTQVEAYNALSAVDRLDRRFTGFRTKYDTLCEFTHPNWFGVLGSYGKLDWEELTLHLGTERRGPPISFGLDPLIMSLVIMQNYYNDLAKLLSKLNEHFEAQP